MAADPAQDSRGLREGGEGEAGGQEEGKEEEEKEERQEEPDETGGHPVHRQRRQHFPADGTNKTHILIYDNAAKQRKDTVTTYLQLS